MTDANDLMRWLTGRPIVPMLADEEEIDLDPPDGGYHCAGCNRYVSVDDGVLAIVSPSKEPWATDYWRIERLGAVIPENRLVVLGLLHEDCQREWYMTVDHNGDIWHGCDTTVREIP